MVRFLFYRYPALTPGLKNPISQIPDTPNNLRVETQGGVSNISWSPADGAFTYVLYATNDSLDMNTGDQIVAVLPKIYIHVHCRFLIGIMP